MSPQRRSPRITRSDACHLDGMMPDEQVREAFEANRWTSKGKALSMIVFKFETQHLSTDCIRTGAECCRETPVKRCVNCKDVEQSVIIQSREGLEDLAFRAATCSAQNLITRNVCKDGKEGA